jgi:hypothetical protein
VVLDVDGNSQVTLGWVQRELTQRSTCIKKIVNVNEGIRESWKGVAVTSSAGMSIVEN